MSTIWHRFPHFEPPEGPELWVRSWLCPTACAIATYVGGSANTFTCVASGWDLPAALLTEWRVAPYPASQVPAPKPLPATRYRDLLRYKPSDQQSCWLRIGSEYNAPFKAVFHESPGAGGGLFVPDEIPTLAYPWWLVALWRPGS